VVSARLLGSGYGNGLSAFMTLAGSSYAREAELEGATPAQQLVYGGIMGLIEGGTEYLTLGKTIDTIFAQGGKPALMAWLKSIPENALQEVAADVASALTKRATYQSEAQLPTIGELGESAALGAGTAGLLGAGAMIPNISQREVIPEVQSQVQPVQEQIQTPEYTGPDRRVDLETRQQVDNGEVAPEQLAELRRQKEFLEERKRRREAEPIVETNPILEPSQNKEAVSDSSKEPWQMTKKEYGQIFDEMTDYDYKKKRDLEFKVKMQEGKVAAVQRRINNVQIPSEDMLQAVAKEKRALEDLKNQLSREEEAVLSFNKTRAETYLNKYPEIFKPLNDYPYFSHEGHEKIIKKAFYEGKPVPPEVLKDYPDLVNPRTRSQRNIFAKFTFKTG
jgi:hypothetical protein